MKQVRYIICICGSFLINTVCLFAQKQKTLSMDGGLYYNSYNIAYHLSVSYNCLFKPNFGVSAGAMFLSASLDVAEWPHQEQAVHYYFDKNNVQHLNIVLSSFYMYPLFSNMGIYVNGSVLFEPIPFDYISIEKQQDNDLISTPESLGRFQYSGFSPGAFAEAGLFHDFNKRDKGIRLFISFGYGWYDMYAVYRRAIIDGQNLSLHLPKDNCYKRITIRIMGI